MPAQILDGKIASESIRHDLTHRIALHLEKGQRKPHLAAVLVGNDGASETYVSSKERNSRNIGMDSTVFRLPAETTSDELKALIDKLNAASEIDGYIVQMPLPAHINALEVQQWITPAKDVDGFHPLNVGLMVKGLPAPLPATPKGILMLLAHYSIDTAGKHCVVVGRSDIVGKPMSILMGLNQSPGNATVTLCHSKTANLQHHTLQADILIVASGKAEMIKAHHVKPGAVVIDVGITRVNDTTNPKGYRIAGDVDFNDVKDIASWITPVPGGVGLMTIAGLLQNTYEAYAQKFPL